MTTSKRSTSDGMNDSHRACTNPLRRYFDHDAERLIDKWNHYFDIYHRHLEKFRGTHATVLEIGVFQGGSLAMWRDYLGPDATIIGVDCDSRCRAFADDRTLIRIGDQGDRRFLQELRKEFGTFDVVIDDGGHVMGQQIESFTTLYPAVSTGGIYLVEDLHTSYWKEYAAGHHGQSFVEFSKQLIDKLNAWHSRDPESLSVDEFTRTTTSMHYYDSVLVLEKMDREPPSRCTNNRPAAFSLQDRPPADEFQRHDPPHRAYYNPVRWVKELLTAATRRLPQR